MPSAQRTWRSSRCSPRARKIGTVTSSCARQSATIARPKNRRRPGVHLGGHVRRPRRGTPARGTAPASGCAGCRATSSRSGRARPRRRTSSRRRPTAARRRRCAGCGRAARRDAPPGRCPGSIAGRGRAGISAPSNRPARASAHRDGGARNRRRRVEEPDRRAGRRPGGAPGGAGPHQLGPVPIERRQDLEGRQRGRREDVADRRGERATNLQWSTVTWVVPELDMAGSVSRS